MTFHIEFEYEPKNRERIAKFLILGGPDTADGIKFRGRWLAVETGLAYAIVESDDAVALYRACAEWSEFGKMTVTAVAPAQDIL